MLVETFAMRFEYDEMGRIVDQVDEGVSPRFVLGRAQEGVVWRFRSDVATELAQDVARLAGREKGIPIDPENTPPPERWVMIERRFAAEDGRNGESLPESHVLHEWVSARGGAESAAGEVVHAEIWSIL